MKGSWFNFSNFDSYAFRFKKVGFDHSTDDNAIFDEFYLVDYVYGSFAKMGDEVMTEAHLLSHFHHVNLASSIAPHHADQSIREIVELAPLQEVGAMRRKKHGDKGQKETAAVGARPTFFAPRSIEV